MSWSFYAVPKAAGDLITSEDYSELLQALAERTSGILSSPPFVAKYATATDLLHQKISSVSPSFVSAEATKQDGEFVLDYSTSAGEYLTDQDIFYVAAQNLGWSGSFISEIHPSIGVVVDSGLRDIYYFNLCREAIRLLRFKELSESQQSDIQALGTATSWADAKQRFLDREQDGTIIIGPTLATGQSFDSGGIKFSMGGRSKETQLSGGTPSATRSVSAFGKFEVGSGDTYVQQNLVINGETISGPVSEGTERIDISSVSFDASGQALIPYKAEAWDDPDVFPQPNLGDDLRFNFFPYGWVMDMGFSFS